MKKLVLVGMMSLVVFLAGCSAEMDYAGEPNYYSDKSYNIESGDAYLSSIDGNSEFSGEGYKEIRENPFIGTMDMQVSTFSADVDTASYSNMRRMLVEADRMPDVDSIRIEELVNYFDYELANPTEEDVFGVTTELAVAPWNENHQLLMIGLTTEEVDFENVPGNNLVFLLDTSGSMNNSNKLPLLINAIKLLVDNLRPIDRISIVTYAGSAGLVLDGADGADREAIINALDDLSAGGSTAGGAGINLAYNVALNHFIEGGNNRVILGTDGDFNVGVSSDGGLEDLIVQKRESGVFLSVLGFGTGNLQDGKMETLADKGNGVYYYIDSILEAKKVFVTELGASLITVAKDVKFQVEFNPLNVKGYRLIGYENRVLNYDDFDNDEIDAGDIGAGHVVIAFYELIPADSDEEIDTREFELVEELKYNGENHPDETMTLSIRYKDPDSDTSELSQYVVESNAMTTTPSETFMFASSVVEFGLLLRNSEYKGTATYESVISRASMSLGVDAEGYRDEFLDLVEIAKLIDN